MLNDQGLVAACRILWPEWDRLGGVVRRDKLDLMEQALASAIAAGREPMPFSATGTKETADFWEGLRAIKAFLAKIDLGTPGAVAAEPAQLPRGHAALE